MSHRHPPVLRVLALLLLGSCVSVRSPEDLAQLDDADLLDELRTVRVHAGALPPWSDVTEEEYVDRLKEAWLERRTELDPATADAIRAGDVLAGMTEEEAEVAIGPPSCAFERYVRADGDSEAELVAATWVVEPRDRRPALVELDGGLVAFAALDKAPLRPRDVVALEDDELFLELTWALAVPSSSPAWGAVPRDNYLVVLREEILARGEAWSEEVRDDVRRGRIDGGMTTAQVLASRGHPAVLLATVGEDDGPPAEATLQEWGYGDLALLFEEGVLVEWWSVGTTFGVGVGVSSSYSYTKIEPTRSRPRPEKMRPRQ